MRTLCLCVVLLCVAAFSGAASSATPTTHWDLQAVDENGAASNELVGSETQVMVEGVVLNNPEDMLNGTADAPGEFMGGQWQIFIQGEGGDHAGTACWMGQYYGKLFGNTHPDDSYSPEAWNAEMTRLNEIDLVGESDTGHLLRMGDRVRVTGYAMFRPGHGKTNINERHSTSNAMDFTVEWLGDNAGPLSPEPITLEDLQADANSAGYDPNYPMFDASRTTGAEYYQGALVRIRDVRFSGGTWGPDETLTLTEGTRSLDCRLGISDDFLQPKVLDDAGFDVIGILDQESGNKEGYRVWVMGYDGSSDVLGIVPEPSSLLLIALAGGVLIRRRRRRG
ncbi:MAG: PEP-CTERM sorting domain-containing protein [Planctomycetota bacterium]